MNALWTKVLVVAAALALVAGGLWYAAQPEAIEEGPVVCTADAMQCPDGSWVGRTGPNCEFVCTPAATTTPPAGGGGSGSNGSSGSGGGGGVACTMEAKLCPDGSYVGRTGPNCEFSACPGGGGGIAPYHSGLKGTVMAGPTCPVERDPPDPSCADKPVATNIWISRANTSGQVIATAYSDSKGAFQLSLPPGEYVVQAGSSGLPFPRCATVEATVGPTGYTTVAISCDTGIR